MNPGCVDVPVMVEAPEVRKDVSEAGVAVQFGLTLGAFYGAFQPSTQETLMDIERKKKRDVTASLSGKSLSRLPQVYFSYKNILYLTEREVLITRRTEYIIHNLTLTDK